MRQIVAGNIGTRVPKLRATLEKYKNMSDTDKDILTAAIIKNLNIPKNSGNMK